MAILKREKKALFESRKLFKEKWRRILPSSEMMLGDQARWEKAQFLGFGEGSNIYDSAYVFGDVKVGRNTWIGTNVLLDGYHATLTIGEYCTIAPGVQIYTHDSVKWALTGGKAKYESAPTSIGDCCFIGAGTIILKGVRIGSRCVVGAHSLVSKNLPDNSVATGVPAKVVARVVVDGDKAQFVKVEGGEKG